MKKLFVFAALILISAAVVFAQTQVTSSSPAMPGLTSSPQFSATQGMFRGAADNFIRPDYYTAMTFDKFYAMTSFNFTNKAQLGYAGKIDNLYIAAAYSGSFWANYTQFNYNEDRIDWLGTGVYKKVPVYSSIALNSSNNVNDQPENRIAILLGTADMGFRFTFSSVNHEYKNINDEFAAGTAGNYTFYKSYETEKGNIIPQIAWAMAKDLTENGIRPYALLDLDFARSYTRAESTAGTGFNGVVVTNSQNHFDPKLTLGLGGYTFYKSDGGFALLADIDYALWLKFYENEYSYLDGVNYKISEIKGLNTNGTLTENTYNGHRITPALVGRWSGGPLALRFRFNLPVIFYGEESTLMTNTSGDLAAGDKSNTFFIGFFPNLHLAAQWKIVPKLSLNVGGLISFGVSRTTTDTDHKATGGAAAYSTQQIREAYGNTTNQLTIGFTFLPTDNLTFEASSGITNNNINVFDSTNGLLSFTSLLVGLKF